MANKREQIPNNEKEGNMLPFSSENLFNQLSSNEREQVSPIVEKIGELSRGQQRVVYAFLSEKRTAEADSIDKLTSRNPEVRDFFQAQQNSDFFRSLCKNISVLPTREEFINCVNGDGPVFNHLIKVREYYKQYDEVLTKLGY